MLGLANQANHMIANHLKLVTHNPSSACKQQHQNKQTLHQTHEQMHPCGLGIRIPCGLGIRIQPMSALVHVVKGDYSRDMNCPIPPAHRITCFLVCSEAYEFGQLGTELSWFR